MSGRRHGRLRAAGRRDAGSGGCAAAVAGAGGPGLSPVAAGGSVLEQSAAADIKSGEEAAHGAVCSVGSASVPQFQQIHGDLRRRLAGLCVPAEGGLLRSETGGRHRAVRRPVLGHESGGIAGGLPVHRRPAGEEVSAQGQPRLLVEHRRQDGAVLPGA